MSSLSTATLTINAAFLQEIKEDHKELQRLLESCQLALNQSPREYDMRSLVEQLTKLLDRLAMHFTLEEAFGYFDDALSVAPRFSARAEELRSEHETMFLALRAIVDDAEQLLYHESPRQNIAAVAATFQQFHDQFQDHESREVELIFAAFDDDVGVGD